MATIDSTRGFRRLATETKAAFKTTEFFAYIVVLVGILLAGHTIEGQEGGADYFAGDKVWLYITLLTVGYMISRGLAKAGSREPYWQESGQNRLQDIGGDGSVTDRVRDQVGAGR